MTSKRWILKAMGTVSLSSTIQSEKKGLMNGNRFLGIGRSPGCDQMPYSSFVGSVDGQDPLGDFPSARAHRRHAAPVNLIERGF